MTTWTSAGENLVRHSSGTIYLRVKVSGKTIRKSLKTTDLRIAKRKRNTELELIHKAAATAGGEIRLIEDVEMGSVCKN